MASQLEVDVAVIGAGPAGSAAAICLARAGARVSLSDRSTFPRQKSCGDGLTTGALRRLEQLGLDISRIPSFRAVKALSVRSPSGRTVNLPFRTDGGFFAAVARRYELDAALVEVARENAATVFSGSRLAAVDEGPGGRLLLGFADGRSISAGYVVACDGAWSEVRRLVAGHGARERGDSSRPQWIAQRGYVTEVRQADAERMWVWYAPELLPGYAWSFPLGDGTANIGVGLLMASGRHLAGAWRTILRQPFFDSLVGRGASLQGPPRAWPIPTELSAHSLSARRGRILFAGDAAGAADPFTGEGIGQALETAGLAARSILEGNGPAGNYVEQVMAGLGREHAVARLCQRIFGESFGASIALRIAGDYSFTRRNLVRWLFEDYPRSALLQPSSWRRAMALKPGPYRAVSEAR